MRLGMLDEFEFGNCFVERATSLISRTVFVERATHLALAQKDALGVDFLSQDAQLLRRRRDGFDGISNIHLKANVVEHGLRC